MTHAPESADPSPFDADAVYLQKTLRHEPMELGLDDSVSLRTLLLLLVRAYLASAIIFFGSGRHLVTVTMKSKLPTARFAVYVRIHLRGVRILPG